MTTVSATPPRAYGALANAWARRLTGDDSFCVADPSGFAAAFVDVVESRRAGRPRGVMALFEHPRRTLLRRGAGQLSNGTYDVFLNGMAAFAAGAVSVNQRPQAAVEASLHGPAIARVWEDLAVTADFVAVRSRYEYELIASAFGTRPSDVRLYAPDDPRVPQPPGSVERTQTIAIWADGIDDALSCAFARMTSDVGLEPVAITDVSLPGVRCVPVAGAAGVVAAARLVVSLSDDPGTARALARFGRPLCAATHGAAEYVANVATFDIWNASEAIDAMLRALGARLPAVAREPAPPPQPAPPPTFDRATAPLVSVVMTVYDRLEHLRRNLQRLQRQTYPNVEVVVVSNGGPPAGEVCSAFPNVRYVHRDENSGEATAPRNTGFSLARGEFVTALDDDDFFLDDHIACMVDACSDGAELVYSNFLLQIVDPQEDGSELLLGYDVEKGKAITPFELLVLNRIGYMTVFARKSLYDRAGGFDETFKGGSEVELWLRWSKTAAMVHVARPTTIYTVRKNWKGSLTGPNYSLFVKGYEQFYERYPSTGLPLIETRRAAHLASLRSSGGAPPREPFYIVPPRNVGRA